jgi:hypothetical protein
MAFPHIDFLKTEPLTEADLDRIISARRAAMLPAGCDQQGRNSTRIAGRDTCNSSCESEFGCTCIYQLTPEQVASAGCAYQGRQQADQWEDNDYSPQAAALWWSLYLSLVLVAVVAGFAALVR